MNTDFPPATWRLIIDGAADGATNMAIDEAIGRTVAQGKAPPTLRFYMWAPPCVSLGRHQKLRDIDLEACAARGYDVVRRPTGGRAILHTDELTYSVAAPDSDPRVAGAVMDAYHRLSQGLVAGLRILGIPANEAPGANRAGPDASPACFEIPSAYEICVDGHKLMGSAQYRSGHMVLQHGSLPLYGDLTRIVDCLALPDEARREALRTLLRRRALTVEAVLGRTPTFQEVAQALAQGFAQALNLHLEPGRLLPIEREMAAELRASRYANPEWTERVGALSRPQR
ncbi:MAG TPA: lipoate--protein ligase family protein [Caldilineae bacterium]|nr:lipoate--protein ligase family protein [Caldilineae bacterium]